MPTLTMTNIQTLYEILGVPKDATRQQIRGAYRRLVLIAHPDKGGTEAAFAKLCEAMIVLTDDEKRKRYDLTGDASDDGMHNIQATALQMIMQALDEACSVCFKSQHDPMNAMLQAMAMDALGSKMKATLERKESFKKTITLTNRMVKRWSRTGGKDNQIAMMLRHKMTMLEQGNRKADQDIKVIEHAMKLLAEYAFTPEQATIMTFVI